MAVWFSSITPNCSRARLVCKKSWSRVSGEAMKASVAKGTRPMRSLGRPAMNWERTSLAMSILSTRWPPSSKSSDAMLPDMSSATTISTPLALISVSPLTRRGWASATTNTARASQRKSRQNPARPGFAQAGDRPHQIHRRIKERGALPPLAFEPGQRRQQQQSQQNVMDGRRSLDCGLRIADCGFEMAAKSRKRHKEHKMKFPFLRLLRLFAANSYSCNSRFEICFDGRLNSGRRRSAGRRIGRRRRSIGQDQARLGFVHQPERATGTARAIPFPSARIWRI